MDSGAMRAFGPDVEVDAAAFVHPTAQIYGRVQVSAQVSIWPNVVERAESQEVRIGRGTNIQDFVMIHVGNGTGTIIGEDWSIADAFYTPVASRFETYGVNLADYGDSGLAAAYGQRLLQTPEYLAWREDALA